MMERKQRSPVIEHRHAPVDPVEGDELSVGLEVREDADDRLREVPVEGEEAGHEPALSCCQRGP